MLDISNDEVLYFKSEFFLIKTTDYSCAAYVRVWQKNLKCRTFLSSFSGQVTQVRTQLLFTYIQSATLTVSKLRGWLVNPTPPLLWDHPCSVIFRPSGSNPFFFAYMYAIFKFNQLAHLHFTRYTDIEPVAIPDCSQMIKKYIYIAIN